jgi:hypothetical protein
MRLPCRAFATLLGAALVASSLLALGAPAVSFASGAPGVSHALLPGASGARRVSLPAAPGIVRLPLSGAPRAPHVPMPGTSSKLEAVSCTTSSNCWAVGTYSHNGADLNQALRWNGTRWSQVTVPSPGGTASGGSSKLFGVYCKSSTDCWAVGYYQNGGPRLDEALLWNGTKWSAVTVPAPGGTAGSDVNELFDVWCTAASNCWAAGEYGSFGPNETLFNQALHWNGSTWSVVSTPNPGGTATNDQSTLESVRCTSAGNCWAVGLDGTISPPTWLNEALHWNGASWSLVTTPSPGGTATGDFSYLAGLSCASATSCWAAGAYGAEGTTFTSLNQVLHWDGGQWSQVTTPNPDGTGAGANNLLAGVACTSASNCWAVGDYGSISGSVGTVLNEALRWNGTNWSLATTPDPAGTGNGASNILNGVRCASASNCWAVGTQSSPGQFELNEALLWNGTKWSAK